MTGVVNLSRRQLLKGLGLGSGLVLGVHVGFRQFPVCEAADAAEPAGRQFEPNVFLAIDGSGLVTIVATRAEMGTGIKTRCPWCWPTSSKPIGRRVENRPGAGRPQIRRPEHRRLAQHLAVLWADTAGRRHRAADARNRSGRNTGRSPVGECRGAKRLRRACSERSQIRFWRPCQARCSNAGAARRQGAAQGPHRMALYRQAALRSSISTTSSTAARSMASTSSCPA